VYWGGARAFNSIPQVELDGGAEGKCSNPKSGYGFHGQSTGALLNGCDQYEVHPLLR
jgi:hypothetical protein